MCKGQHRTLHNTWQKSTFSRESITTRESKQKTLPMAPPAAPPQRDPATDAEEWTKPLTEEEVSEQCVLTPLS
jgi:hypothetical protein